MHRTHIEYVIRKLHYLKTDRKENNPDFLPTGDWWMTNCVLSRWTHDKKSEHHVPMDNNPSMGIKEQEGMSNVNCFSCKHQSGLMGTVQEFAHHAIPEGLMTKEERDDLLDYIMLAEEDDTLVIEGKEKKLAQPVPEDILECLGELHDDEVAEYLDSRGFTGEDFELFQLGYHEETNRLMFPIITAANYIPMVQGRTLGKVDKNNPKYKNFPKNFEKQDYLYGEHLIKDETEVLVVGEGMADVITANRVLRENGLYPQYVFVGVMGSSPSDAQLQKIQNWSKEVVPFGDDDNPGKLMNKKLTKALKNKMKLSVVKYPKAEEIGIKLKEGECLDPDKLGEHILPMLDQRKNYLEMQLELLFKKGMKS